MPEVKSVESGAPGSTTYWLCDHKQAISLLCASVSPSVKWDWQVLLHRVAVLSELMSEVLRRDPSV